jgi:hypothetical protein
MAGQELLAGIVGVFWPVKIKGQPDAIVRAGRVIHWSVTFCVVLLFLLIAFQPRSLDVPQVPLAVLAAFAAALSLAARLVRYVVSGE